MIERACYSGDVSKLYSRLARVYDLFTDHEPAHLEEAIQLAGIREDDSVLEVACGTGRASAGIARRLREGGRLYAIDLTEAMVERAERRLREQSLIDRVDLRLGDARSLPFPDGKFDVVYNSYMFDLMDAADIPGIVSEFKRVLKPGGRIVLVNMSKNKDGRTLYEFLYEKGFLGFASGGCRPVLMKPFLDEAGFKEVQRIYRENRSYLFLNRLTGTEIVWGHK